MYSRFLIALLILSVSTSDLRYNYYYSSNTFITHTISFVVSELHFFVSGRTLHFQMCQFEATWRMIACFSLSFYESKKITSVDFPVIIKINQIVRWRPFFCLLLLRRRRNGCLIKCHMGSNKSSFVGMISSFCVSCRCSNSKYLYRVVVYHISLPLLIVSAQIHHISESYEIVKDVI